MICDINEGRGKIDFKKLSGKMDFIIIRSSVGMRKDTRYMEYVNGCNQNGIPYHVFHYLKATNEEQARTEAKVFSQAVEGTNPLFYVIDAEYSGIKANKAQDIIDAFEDGMRHYIGKDIHVAIYIAHELYRLWKLDYSKYEYVWIPRYGRSKTGRLEDSIKPDHPCDLWQYTEKGRIDGINADVDLDVLTGTKPLSFFIGEKRGEESMASDYKKYILSNGTHYISNSGSDENGGLKGGKAGDQNGKEWRLRSWYNRPWTCVLRWPDINVGTLLAQLGIDAALNDKIGYDQGQRYTYQEQLAKVGWLPAKITKACEEDCTAGVNANVHAAGHLLNIPKMLSIPEKSVRSGNMRKYYKAAGFEVLTESKYLKSGDYLLPGDVLLYDNHHGATNVTCGKKVRDDYAYHDAIGNLDEYRYGPKPEPEPTPEPAKQHVKVTGGRVNVRSGPGTDSKDIGTAHKGDVLPYKGLTKRVGDRDWYSIVYNNKDGWISSKYSELTK